MYEFLNNQQNLIIFGVLLLTIILIIVVTIMNYFTKVNGDYLNQLNDVTMAQLKSPIGRLQRYSLIKSLRIMKKFIGWSIFLIITVCLGLSTIVVFDSRDYFKLYFEVRKKKLELCSNACVDSLQTEIKQKQFVIDSLKSINTVTEAKLSIIQNSEQENKRTIRALTKIVK